jgi:chromosome partitioning protein
MARTIAIANQKGGVGKTTTAINLGASLATADLRVLVVDLDPQGNCTSGFGIDKEALEGSVYELLIGTGDPSVTACPTELDSLQVLPSNRELIGATIELLDGPSREFRLQRALASYQEHYDYILIDCPPALGILTVNALVAANSLLIPIQCEFFALEGLSELMGTLHRIQQSLNPDLEIEGVLLTMHDERLNLCNQIRQDVRSHFGDQVFQTVVPRNVSLAESPGFGQPILLYDVRSKGADSYLELAREILKKPLAQHSPHESLSIGLAS